MNVVNDIQYSDVEKKLENLRASSIEYLQKALKSEKVTI